MSCIEWSVQNWVFIWLDNFIIWEHVIWKFIYA